MIALLIFDTIVISLIIYLIVVLSEKKGRLLISFILIILVICSICAGGAIENIRLSDSESDNSKIIDIDTSSKNTITIKIK